MSRFSTYAAKIHCWDALVRVFRYDLIVKTTIEVPFVIKLIDTSSIDSSTVSIIFVSTSSTEAEYIASSETCSKEGSTYFRNLLNEFIKVTTSIKVWVDYIGARCIAQNAVNNARTKHIDMRYHMIRDWISKGIIELFYIESTK